MSDRMYYRVSNTLDFEERLEDAAMMYALKEAGLDIQPIDQAPANGLAFGRFGHWTNQEVEEINKYWYNDFVSEHCNRKHEVCNLDRAVQLHKEWGGVFLKHTRAKRGTWKVPADRGVQDVLEADVYEFCDAGDVLLAQELVEISDETRCFVVGGSLITWSLTMPDLTPLVMSVAPDIFPDLYELAAECAEILPWSHYAVDVAFVNGKPGIVEVNPAVPGKIGLYASDVMTFAQAFVFRGCHKGYLPNNEPPGFRD